MRYRGKIGFSLAIAALVWAELRVEPVRVETTASTLHAENGVLIYRDRPFSGILVERYGDGRRYRETQYEAGLPDGVTKRFALNGRLTVLGRFAHGRREGQELGWYDEGPKRFDYRFKHGVLEGVQTEWHLNGAVFREETYSDGVETDKKILFPHGEIFTNSAKREGRTYGIDGGALCMERKKEGVR